MSLEVVEEWLTGKATVYFMSVSGEDSAEEDQVAEESLAAVDVVE